MINIKIGFLNNITIFLQILFRKTFANITHSESDLQTVAVKPQTILPRRNRRYYLPTPPLGQDITQGQFLSGV